MSSLSPHISVLISSLALGFLAACVEGREATNPEVVDSWARPAAVETQEDGRPTPANSAVYLTLRNPGSLSAVLVGAETTVARVVEVHESFLEGDVMRMREVDRVEVPAGGEVRLRPGGLHLMLLGLRESLEVGDTLSLTLHFQSYGSREVRVPVRTMGAG